MASAKDTFEANTFEANSFACGTWRGVGAAAVFYGRGVLCTYEGKSPLYSASEVMQLFTTQAKHPLYGSDKI